MHFITLCASELIFGQLEGMEHLIVIDTVLLDDVKTASRLVNTTETIVYHFGLISTIWLFIVDHMCTCITDDV